MFQFALCSFVLLFVTVKEKMVNDKNNENKKSTIQFT